MDRTTIHPPGRQPAVDPATAAIRDKIKGLAPERRYSAALNHVAGDGDSRMYDVSPDLRDHPEEATGAGMAVADLNSPQAAVKRAGHSEQLVAALAGIEHDASITHLGALSEYARQARAGVQARKDPAALKAANSMHAAAIRDITSRVHGDGPLERSTRPRKRHDRRNVRAPRIRRTTRAAPGREARRSLNGGWVSCRAAGRGS